MAGVAAGAAAGLAGFLAQHRAVRRAEEAARRGDDDEELALPGDLVHHAVVADDGGTIHVVERGQGPALLLLHGVMLRSDVWVHQLTDLAAHHRVVAVDLRGHGASVPGGAGLRPPAVTRLAADVRTVVDELDLRDALLVGHSMGGMVAQQLLLDMADEERHRRFRGVVLVSTTAGPLAAMPGWAHLASVSAPASRRALRLAERAGATTGLLADDLRWWLTRFGFGPDPVPAQVRFVEQLHRTTSLSTFGQLLAPLALFDVSADLEQLDLPALVVVGSRDRLTHAGRARQLAAGLPRAELVELPRCGHMPMLERRHEFSRLLEEFCAKVS
jgi:3-oxoadipate enol-lactonase